MDWRNDLETAPDPAEERIRLATLRAAIDMARLVAITLETASDAADLRKQAAAGALHAFAEAAHALALSSQPNTGLAVFVAIANLPGEQGETVCPEWSGRFRWIRDSTNGHIHGACDAGCLRAMQ